MINYKKVYAFKEKIRNRYSTNHDISEWFYIGENQNIQLDDKKNYLEFISTNYSPNTYIWVNKSLHKNQKEAIVINMNNNILQNKYLKFGLINKKVISNINDYEQLKILQFVNINGLFSLEFFDENLIIDKDIKTVIKIVNKIVIKDIIEDIANEEIMNDIIEDIVEDEKIIYEFPSKTEQFYFMNTEERLEFHYNCNKKWKSFDLQISLKDDCFFFFEIIGLHNIISLRNIHQDTYLESEIR